MRRKGYTLSTDTIVKLVIGLVIFAVILMMARVGSGKLGEAMDSAVDYFRDLFSMCSTDLGPTNFDDFLKAMENVYDECKYEDDCGKTTCVTVDLTTDGVGCYRVNRAAILKYTGEFAYLPFCTIAFGTYSLYCNEVAGTLSGIPDTNPFGSFFDNVVYYGTSGPNYCEFNAGLGGCMADYFSVGQGAKVKLTAKKSGLIFKETDLKVKVKGGTGYTACTPYVNNAPPECAVATEALDCIKTPWGWCDGGRCRYDRFCMYRETDPRCRVITTTCSFDGGCIPAANVPCPAIGVQSDLVGLMWPGTPALRITYSESGLEQRIAFNDEKCYAYNNAWDRYSSPASCKNPLAKVSMAVKMIATVSPTEYTITYYQGCY